MLTTAFLLFQTNCSFRHFSISKDTELKSNEPHWMKQIKPNRQFLLRQFCNETLTTIDNRSNVTACGWYACTLFGKLRVKFLPGVDVAWPKFLRSYASFPLANAGIITTAFFRTFSIPYAMDIQLLRKLGTCDCPICMIVSH
jgi:hypothetical protein